MSSPASCREAARLQQMLEGTLPADEQTTIAEHLAGCPACQVKYEELSASLRLVPQESEKPPVPGETVLQELMQRLDDEWPLAASEDSASATEDISLSFLSPPEQPDHLGRLTQLAATVIRILRPEGTLEITVDDPAVKVTIDGEEISIDGTGPQEFRLGLGQHQFQATKDGTPVHQELVTITRGGKQIVKVALASPQSTPTRSPPEPTPPPVRKITGTYRELSGNVVQLCHDPCRSDPRGDGQR